MKKYKRILINFIKIIYLIAVFWLSLLFFGHFMSQGNDDMTAEMAEATLPVIHIELGNNHVNYLYGYTEPMDCSYMRDTMTVVDSSRKIDYVIETYDTHIDSMRFEVRSIDGSRLVENTEINAFSTGKKEIKGNIVVKDLIENGNEYMLIWILELEDGQTARYYTRLLWAEDLHVQEKVDFVREFSEKTFDKEAATELTKYLESDSSGNSSSFSYTNIHSSFNQVTWGDLLIRRLGEPRISVRELTAATGYFKIDYWVEIKEESGWSTCNVSEYFRIRYTTDRIYLLNWERYCNQLFDENGSVYVGDQIELGITSSDIELVESDGGNEFAFVQEGKLIAVNITEQKIARLYSFYGNDVKDLRNSHREYEIHILSVDEVGNVSFIVYGYMNRGRHEGRVGLALFEYNSAMNTVEEKAYIDYSRSAAMLIDSVNELSYMDRDGKLYFMLERNVYEVNPDEQTIVEMASELKDDSYYVSKDGRMVVWEAEGDVYECTRLRLMNLATGISEDIKAGYGEYILPLGYMEDDLVYGIAKTRDVTRNIDGTMSFPMYKIIIRSGEGEILKEYAPSGIYVMDCTFSEGMMSMSRAVYNDSKNTFESTDSDQIMSTVETVEHENNLKEALTESLETVVQISMKEELSENDSIHLTPKEIIYEGSRELKRNSDDHDSYYYVYGIHGYMGSFIEVSNAVNYAYSLSGVVVDGGGKCIWSKTTRVAKNQIMAITEPDKTTPENSLAECVDTMLRFEGFTTNSRILLAQGQSIYQILSEYMSEDTVLNLNGCNLDTVLYFVNKDIPVLAIRNDLSAVLITGFNDSQIVLYDPGKGELYKVNMTDADDEFRSNGYKFISYIK